MKHNQLLADLVVFNTKLDNLHFNVTGMQYPMIHMLLEKFMDELNPNIEGLKEQMVLEGLNPQISLQSYLNNTQLSEVEIKKYKSNEVLDIVLSDSKVILNSLQEIKDESSDLIGNHLDEIQPIFQKIIVAIYNINA